jgi:hypothetical protein
MEPAGWITLAAVVVALGLGLSSIIQTNRLKKAEKRERLLNEIIEWAEDIIKGGWEPFNPIPSVFNNADIIKANTFLWNETMRSLVQFEVILSKQARFNLESIKLILGKDLSQAIEVTLRELREHINIINRCLDEFGQYSTDSATLKKRNENLNAIGIHKRQLNDLAQKIMEEAAKTQTGDIG